MAVSKKLRFEVFRRDNFACRYCGATAKDGAFLEPDHVVPRARGGKDVATNLVTACDACNSGKSDTSLSARPIEDVPQELFRRACLERGVPGVDLGGDDETHLNAATEILSYLRGEELPQALDAAREWVVEVDEVEPTPANVDARAAERVFGDAHSDVINLTRIVERLIRLQPLDVVDQVYAAARDHFDRNYGKNSVPRDALFVAAGAKWFLRTQDEKLLASIPGEELGEWTEYARSLFGDSPWGLNEEELAERIVLVIRVVRDGRHYPEMCCAAGEHIPNCPDKARLRAWVNECSHCDPGSPTADQGHPMCERHVARLRDGSHIGRKGHRLSLRKCESLDLNAEEVTS